MTSFAAQKIVDAAASIGRDVSHRPGYSGRGMFGKTTVGVVGSQSDIHLAIATAAYELGINDSNQDDKDDGDRFLTEIGRLSWDSMGRELIAY